jgi:signal transduction histidine kinase
MTMISEPDMPAIEIGTATRVEEQAAVGKPSDKSIIGAVIIGTSLITLVNIIAAVYLYRGISDMRFLEGRLEQLGTFEQRIGGRLDTVNNGFQSRFEKLDSQLQSSFGEINRSIARLEQNQPVARDDVMSSAAEPSMVAANAVAEAPVAVDGEDATEPSVVDAPRAPKKRIVATAPAPSPNYQRIEQADGKVYYRKIN